MKFRSDADESSSDVDSKRPSQKPDPLFPTIFHEPWWLDVVTQGNWDVVETWVGGKLEGRMPYHMLKTLWFRVGRMPQLTHFLGPAIVEGPGRPAAKHLHDIRITRDLICRLPDCVSFYQKMHRGVEDVLAFQLEGYETSVQFTYEIEPQPWDSIWLKMRDKSRNAYRRGASDYSLADISPKDFTDRYMQNVNARGWVSNIDRDTLLNTTSTCVEKNRGKLFSAVDRNGEPKAAIFCIWDQTSYYYLASFRERNSGYGAVTFLICEAIRHCLSKDLIFDFDGIGDSGAVNFYASFGATIRPRYIVTKSKARFRLMREARRILLGPDNAFR